MVSEAIPVFIHADQHGAITLPDHPNRAAEDRVIRRRARRGREADCCSKNQGEHDFLLLVSDLLAGSVRNGRTHTLTTTIDRQSPRLRRRERRTQYFAQVEAHGLAWRVSNGFQSGWWTAPQQTSLCRTRCMTARM